jgi:hypothetical protein
MHISRRTFVEQLATTAGAAAFLPACHSAVSLAIDSDLAVTGPDTRPTFSAPLTHSDWMLKPGMKWGAEGVRHMLDACKACGWSRIHWRALDGGRATYPSKVVRPSYKVDAESSIWNPKTDAEKALYKKFFGGISEERRKQILGDQQRYDYGSYDTFAEAVRYGHQIGLKIDAWVSINEDDHGWGIESDFARDHQQFVWIKRDGTRYHSQMSFAFPEVRAYKLSIIDELLTKYDIDGLFLDWIRTGDIRDNPQNDSKGTADYGYEQPNIKVYEKEYSRDAHLDRNDDERWVRTRAEPQTVFMREVRKRVRQHKKQIPIAVMVGHPWHYRGMQDPIAGNLRGLLLDVTTWAKERLMDSVVAAGYYLPEGNAAKVYENLQAETGGGLDVWYYAWVPNTPEEFNREYNVVRDWNPRNILFWEADYIDDRPQAAALKQAMSAKAKW